MRGSWRILFRANSSIKSTHALWWIVEVDRPWHLGLLFNRDDELATLLATHLRVEYRATDATANPYVQLAVLARAGLQGIRDNEPAPTPTTGDLSLLTNDQLAKIGVVRLPSDLQSALDLLANERLLRSWFPREFVEVFLAHKAGEIAFLQDKDAADIRRRYAAAY